MCIELDIPGEEHLSPILESKEPNNFNGESSININNNDNNKDEEKEYFEDIVTRLQTVFYSKLKRTKYKPKQNHTK